MGDICSRLNDIAKHYNLSKYSDFAKTTGLSHQSASNYLKGKQKPDIDKLSIIKQSFDIISSDWLLTGRGEMLISESTPHLSTDSIIDLTEYLFDHNETLMTDPLFRKYIESNIITLEIEREK